jgi:hypothetical protein
MKLCDIVRAIVVKEDITGKDIENTILFLVQDSVLRDVRVLRRIVKKLNDEKKYEDGW